MIEKLKGVNKIKADNMIYSFTLIDDLLGWDKTEQYQSNISKNKIKALWEMSKGNSFKERINFVKLSCENLGGYFKPLVIEEGFSME